MSRLFPKLSVLCSRLMFLVVLIGISAASLLVAQTGSMNFDHLGIEDGLSENIVLSIAQDRQGYMWFGSADGLNQYNGYEFTIFKHDPRDTTSLTHNYVQALHVDRAGTMWIGSLGGLDWYDPVHEVFHHVSLRASGATGARKEYGIQSIIEDSSGALWLGTTGGGVFKLGLTYSTGKPQPAITILKNYTTGNADLPSMFTFPVATDVKGNIWVASLEDGMSILDPATETITHFLHNPKTNQSLTGNRVRTVFFDGDGMLWIGTEDAGLTKLDREAATFQHYTSDRRGGGKLPNNTIRGHYRDTHGRIWVATDGGGLLQYNAVKDSFTAFRHNPAQPASLANDRVISIYEDRAGTLWFGTWGSGVDRWSPVKEKFSNDERSQYIINNLSNKFIISFFEDSRGMLWVGTHGGGAVSFDPLTRSLERFEPHPAPSNGLMNGAVWSIKEDNSGNIWFATDMGVQRYNVKQKTFTLYDDAPSGKGKLSSHFTGYAQPIDSVVWVTSEKAIDKIDVRTGTITNFQYKLGSIDSTQGFICGVYKDPFNVIWLGTNPISLFDTKTEQYIPPPLSIGKRPVSCIIADKVGNIWIGTFDDGVYIFDASRKLIGHYTDKNGLPNNVVYGVIEDDNGNYWMSTNRGISKFTFATRSFRNYDVADGLQSNEFNRCAFLKTRNGMMYFGGINGFNAFHPDSIKDNPYIPPVELTVFRKFNEQVRFGESLPYINSIALEHWENFFSFEFAALSFVDPAKNRYAYKLEGFDRDWVYSGTRRFAAYTNLSPGEYTFHVKASNNDGAWNEQGVSKTIVILPPWWRTWWAYLLYGILLVAGGAGTRWLVNNWKIIVASRKAHYVSHYKLAELLGEGGMGKVYKAHDMNTKQIVALKILNPALLKDEENKKRLMNEGRLLSSFSHPGIVKVFEISDSEESAFIAMEYLSGGTLKQAIERSDSMPVQEMKKIVLEICDGLHEIHSRGIIHRDIKSANIMFDAAGNVRIMDFGLSKSPLVTTMTTLGTVIGTLGYVAPEQVTGLNVDLRVDIFSFGVLLYEMLTKKLPFTGENEIAVIHSIFNTSPPPPSTVNRLVPQPLDSIVMRCLEKNPAVRYASISEVKIELDGDFW